MEVEIQLSSTEEFSKFQHLYLNPSWLVWRRASRHQKTRFNILMDRQLLKGDLTGFSRNGSVAMTKQEIPSVSKGWLSTNLSCWEAAVYTLD